MKSRKDTDNHMTLGRVFGRVYDFHHDNVLTFGEIKLDQIGETCCEEGTTVLAHDQWCYEISVVISGEGTFYSDDVPTVVRERDIVFNSNRERHEIKANRGKRLRYMYLGFMPTEEGRSNATLREVIDFFDRHHGFRTEDRADVCGIMRRGLQELWEEQICGTEILSACLLLVILLSYRCAMSAAPVRSMVFDTTGDIGGTVYSFIRYVDDHVLEITSLRALAEKLGYSYSYVSHLFREKTGGTLQDYIRTRKMEKAQEFMAMGLSVSQTAERLGYKSVQAFSKAYKAVRGESPSLSAQSARSDQDTN